MKVIQIMKQLNNTELGKGGTHDTYVLIPSELDVRDIFRLETPTTFTDKQTGGKFTFRHTESREKRIVGMGEYYRSKNLWAGDEIMFEKREIAGEEEYYVDVKRSLDSLVFQKSGNGFELLTPQRVQRITQNSETLAKPVEVNFLHAARKRQDSPDTTDFYDILVGGQSILGYYSGKEIGIVRVLDGEVKRMKFYGWKKYIFETQEGNE